MRIVALRWAKLLWPLAAVACAPDAVAVDSEAIQLPAPDALPRLALTGDSGFQPIGTPPLVRITDVVKIGGTYVLADAGSATLVMIESDTVHVLGRPGDGPGEYRGRLLLSVRADTLFVFDHGLQRLTAIDVTTRQTVRTEPQSLDADGRIVLDARVLESGARVRILSDGLTWSEGDRATTWWIEHLHEGRADTFELAEGSTSLMVNTGDGALVNTVPPFYRSSWIATAGDWVYFNQDARLRVLRWNGGDADTLISGAAEWGRVVTDGQITAELDYQLATARADPGVHSFLRTVFAAASFPARAPAIGGLLVEEDGALWIKRYTPPSVGAAEWVLVEPDGSQVLVTFPDGFVPMSVTDGEVAGVLLDSLDVQTFLVLPRPEREIQRPDFDSERFR